MFILHVYYMHTTTSTRFYMQTVLSVSTLHLAKAAYGIHRGAVLLALLTLVVYDSTTVLAGPHVTTHTRKKLKLGSQLLPLARCSNDRRCSK